MRELTWENAPAYLQETERVPAGQSIRVRELSGGVSNVVLRVDLDDRPSFVIKQCRERLRVAMDWRARLDRIWAERAALDVLGALLPPGTVPQVYFEDRPNYLFAMTCAPDDSETWKTHLMHGQTDPRVASRLGTILGTIHAEAQNHPEMRGTLADTSLFEELRLDPYYRTISRAHTQIAPSIEALIAAMNVPPSERTLVLGDFSPKNILVHSEGLILLDFECAHGGDAAFDLGFFLSHLLLKTIHMSNCAPDVERQFMDLTVRFWNAYLDRIGTSPWRPEGLVPRAIGHAAACVLARVDGKSPVEYLDAGGQELARRLAFEAIETQPRTWDEMLSLLERQLHRQR
jgi:5-methylthioribose kinase